MSIPGSRRFLDLVLRRGVSCVGVGEEELGFLAWMGNSIIRFLICSLLLLFFFSRSILGERFWVQSLARVLDLFVGCSSYESLAKNGI